MIYRSADDPDLLDAIGGQEPPPMGTEPDGEHAEHLRAAYKHMASCRRRIERALDLLDEGPLGGPDAESGLTIGYDDDADRRSALTRQYARAVKSAIAPNV